MADVFKSKVVNITSAGVELLAAPGTSGDISVINMLQIGNVHGSATGALTLSLNKNGAGDTTFADNIQIETGKSAIIFSDANGKLTLENGGTADSLTAIADANNVLVAIMSYMERT